MNSMFLIFYLFLNTIGGYLFVETAPEKAYPDIARISQDIRISESGELRDGTIWLSFLKGLDTASASRVLLVMPDEADMLLTYDAVKETYTLKEMGGKGKAITYKHLIRMDGQRIADMTFDNMVICFAENPADFWYWYVCDDIDVTPKELYRYPDKATAHLLFTVRKADSPL
ncbi:hypothetical protein MKC73_12225 [[Clostridium] innocuum]|nr:hypothetical protein [[Clostridium] innocuum]